MSGALYVDMRTRATYPLTPPRCRSDTGGPLMLSPLEGIDRSEIDLRERSLWRYRAAFPVRVDVPVTLGEGCTPLIERPWLGAPALFKLEWFSPTGSFKDRGASVMISILREQGIQQILEDSSVEWRRGNRGLCVSRWHDRQDLGACIDSAAGTGPR